MSDWDEVSVTIKNDRKPSEISLIGPVAIIVFLLVVGFYLVIRPYLGLLIGVGSAVALLVSGAFFLRSLMKVLNAKRARQIVRDVSPLELNREQSCEERYTEGYRPR